ncbi:MAG: hypothetical protein SNF33_05335 [Candidatus Algichlamydia australiensis]|nr:hypothetical protein [Chlamydiales bacterium]
MPDNSVVVFSDVSGETIRSDARKELKDIHNTASEGRDNAKEQEEQIEEQYYSYLTSGSSDGSNLCSA